MSDLKDNLKKFGSSARKALIVGAKAMAENLQETAKESSRKRQIVGKMYEGTIKELARQRGLHPEPFLGGKPTIDDYKESILSNVSLTELIEFARKKRIDIRDVTDSINEDEARKEQKKLDDDASVSDEFKKVAQTVREFMPLKNYPNEYQYQAELTQWLRARFPNTNIEVQRGSSRPDIVVNGIAVEVKGPTWDEDLRTIADKLVRYPQWFRKGIIIALFNVHVNPHLYEEWAKGITKSFTDKGHLEIVKK